MMPSDLAPDDAPRIFKLLSQAIDCYAIVKNAGAISMADFSYLIHQRNRISLKLGVDAKDRGSGYRKY
jgi:hypothetical protein